MDFKSATALCKSEIISETINFANVRRIVQNLVLNQFMRSA